MVKNSQLYGDHTLCIAGYTKPSMLSRFAYNVLPKIFIKLVLSELLCPPH